MKEYLDFDSIAETDKGLTVAIGNFDGVHLGHQQLIRRAQDIAGDGAVGVLSFEPHPRSLFRPDETPFRIAPYPVKRRRLRGCNVDTLFTMEFNHDIAAMSAENFVTDILVNKLAVKHVVVGKDFCFGAKRSGDLDTLQKLGKKHGFEVTGLDLMQREDGLTYSSTQIRTALRENDIEAANALLGWEWEIEGTVEHGDKRGRELGYPTVNVPLNDTLHPGFGIYATWIAINDDSLNPTWLPSVSSIGIRPMFKTKEPLLETFIFDFETEIYGQSVRVKPVKRIRSEEKFDSLDALIEQMDQDCKDAKRILGVA